MLKTKINKLFEKINYIKSDITIPLISDFLDWFIEIIDLHFNNKTLKLKFNKWDIYLVNLWKNIWMELNKERPCIVYSKRSYNTINSIIVLPLKGKKIWKKLINKFHIEIKKSKFNYLWKDSICDIFYIRNISTKRVGKFIWKLENEYLSEIDEKISRMFDIKIKDGI